MSKRNVHRNGHRWDAVGGKKKNPFPAKLITEQEQSGLDNQEEEM